MWKGKLMKDYLLVRNGLLVNYSSNQIKTMKQEKTLNIEEFQLFITPEIETAFDEIYTMAGFQKERRRFFRNILRYSEGKCCFTTKLLDIGNFCFWYVTNAKETFDRRFSDRINSFYLWQKDRRYKFFEEKDVDDNGRRKNGQKKKDSYTYRFTILENLIRICLENPNANMKSCLQKLKNKYAKKRGQ